MFWVHDVDNLECDSSTSLLGPEIGPRVSGVRGIKVSSKSGSESIDKLLRDDSLKLLFGLGQSLDNPIREPVFGNTMWPTGLDGFLGISLVGCLTRWS
jgi:hypothetical protein